MDSTLKYGAHVRANGIRQHYLRYGARGRPLIVVPGITSPAITWGFVGERLGTHFDTFVLDVRGRGLSETGAHLDYTLDTYANDVAGFAEALGLGPVGVLGHSMGGRIAVRLARRYPRVVERVVIADPPVSGPGRRPFGRPLEYYSGPLARARDGLHTFDEVRAAFPKWSDDAIRLRAEWLHTCDPTAISETVRGFGEDDVHRDFAALGVPALLVVAGKGGMITDEDVAALEALQPRLAVTTIAHAGHMIPFEDLEAFLDAIVPFLRASYGTPGRP